MRVIQATQFGGPEVLVPSETPDPVAGPGEVVVDVVVAPTLFVETQIRRGQAREWFPVEPPYVPGAGVAGRVRSIGDGVDAGWVVRRVVADTRAGGYAERVAVPANTLIAVPDGLGLREAAAVLHDGRTAMRLAAVAEIRPGEWVLVTAAGGGLGALLVQLAQAEGAHLIGAARGKQKLDLAVELGAEVVVDYSESGWTERVLDATGGAGVDVVFDGAGGEIGLAAFGVTAAGGRFSAHGAPSGGFTPIDRAEAERRGITLSGIEDVQLSPEDGKRFAEQALAEAAAGRIRPVIGQTFPLERAADAHAAIEARDVIGKTLLLTNTGVADEYVSLSRDGNFEEILDRLLANDVVRVEPLEMTGTPTEMRGIDAVATNSRGWIEGAEVRGLEVDGPFMGDHFAGDKGRFAVRFAIDVALPSGERTTITKMELNTVEDGKIVRNEIYYHANPAPPAS
jgi:NADPH:quinone reductase